MRGAKGRTGGARCAGSQGLLDALRIETEEESEANPRSADRRDCANYRRCFDEAAVKGRASVCGQLGHPDGCAMYEPDLNEPKRAAAELQSHAWMWEEA